MGRPSFAIPDRPPSGRLVVAAFAVVAGLLVAAVAGLAAAHGTGRLVDLFVLGSGLILAYAGGLELAPLAAVALVATYVALESHYGRLDGSHLVSMIAFSIVFGCAALASGALGGGFRSWNRAAEAEAPGEEAVLEAETLDGVLERAVEHGGALCLLLARPDGIDQLAAERGEDAAHAVLEHVDRVLRAHLRPEDSLSRNGLFEFWIVLPRTSLEAARATAERLRVAASEPSVELEEGELVRSSLSVGVASRPLDGRSVAELRAAAERAATAAEQLGGNRTVLHSVPPGAPRGWGLAPQPRA